MTPPQYYLNLLQIVLYHAFNCKTEAFSKLQNSFAEWNYYVVLIFTKSEHVPTRLPPVVVKYITALCVHRGRWQLQ